MTYRHEDFPLIWIFDADSEKRTINHFVQIMLYFSSTSLVEAKIIVKYH